MIPTAAATRGRRSAGTRSTRPNPQGRRLPITTLVRAALLVAVALLLAPTAAEGAGTPNIALSKSAPDVLYGEDATVTLHASNPSSQPTGYNLSFNDVLPPGVSYVAGSSPASVGEPRVVNNAPTPGSTTLIWENVADLTPNSSFEFSFRVSHSTSFYDAGDTYADTAGAYINCDPRYAPDFGPNGQAVQSGGNADCTGSPAEQSYTGSATASATTTLKAIELNKSVADAPEGELLRGLHDHQTVYTLEATNNGINPTTGLDLEDYIPAGLEFLACGSVDNTTDAPTNPGSSQEYPGSGPINPGNAPAAPGCLAPTTVETVANPPGLPAGVYTHVVWEDVADLSPGQTFTLRYVAAIPLRANTLDWNGTGIGNGIAPGTGGAQAANLDNNSGPETYEDDGSEPAFTNTATATGSYQDGSPGGREVSDDDHVTVHAEDLRIVKSVDDDSLTPGGISEWTLAIATGEYRFVDDIVVTDTLGDGYCPLGSANFETTPPAADPECDPVGGTNPSSPYASAVENADGSWTLGWDSSTMPELARIDPSSTATITFPSRTRQNYQENFTDASPVLARDTAGNDVDVEGDDFIICAPGAPSPCPIGDPNKIDADEADGTRDSDDSSASQTGAGPTIDKSVATAVNQTPCPTGAGAYGKTAQPTRPGQTLCYRLRMDFPSSIATGGVKVSDFIPPGTAYVPGSTIATPNNNVTIATASPPSPDVNGSNLTWTLDDGADAVGKAQVFEVAFAVYVTRRAASIDGDLLDNLMKASYVNSDGVSFPLRDSVPFELQQPEITLIKGVRDVNDGPVQPIDADYNGVVGGDVVTYRVDITNDGSVDAENAEIWDLLPPEFDCTMVANIATPGGSSATCNAGQNRIEWTGVDIAANSTTTLTYDVTIPDGYSSGDAFVNTAGVRQYEHDTGGNGPFISIPADNIDPTQDPSANAGPADDPARVTVLAVPMSKTRMTQVNEPGNNAASQATIGERINYTVSTTIPAGTTLYGSATINDPLGSRQTLVAGSAAATLDSDGPGGAAPVPLPTAGLTLTEDTAGNLVRVNFPATYANAQGSGADIVAITFSATVDDDFPANQARGTSAQRTLGNTATLTFQNAAGTTRTRTASTSTTIVEPDVGISKSSNAGATVAPGDVVDYTLVASNAAGSSRANGTTIIDTIPAGLTPVNGAGNPVADGGTVNPDGGIWDATARTITWTIGALDPGGSVTRRYSAQVDLDAIGSGALTNTARVETRSLAGGVNDSGRRTSGSAGLNAGNDYGGYRADASHTLRLLGATISKATTPASGTIGEQLTHTLTVRIPPNLQFFDATVIDDIPDGLDFESYVSATCSAGCAPGPTNITPATLGSVANGNGTRIGWSFGDLASAPAERVVTLVYTTRIANTYNGGGDVADGDDLTNTATLAYNTADAGPPPTSPPDPGDFDDTSTDTSTSGVVEPLLVIDKDVSGDPDDDDARDADPGSSFTYTLRITNNGNSPAYDVDVTDQPDSELTNVVLGTGAAFNTDPWSSGDPDMAWTIPGPIQPGNSVTLTYTADLVPSAQLSNLQQVVNTADIPSYQGVDPADQDPGVDYRTYTDVDSDTVTVTVRMPDLEVVKTTGAAGFPDVADARVEVPFGWRFVISNPNAGSTLRSVDATDVLPKNWTYVAGSAQVSGTGTLTPGGQVDPTVTADPDGDSLLWSNLGSIAGGQTIVVSFDATPQSGAALDPGEGAVHVNDVDAAGEDASGATGSAAGPYTGSDDATADLQVPSADLAITKVADDPTPIAGTDTTWTLNVANNGPETAPSVVVTDTLPAELSYVSAVPEQGSCSFASPVITCELGRMGSGDVVEIKLTTTVAADTEGQTIVNPAEVDDPAVDDTEPDNNSDEDQVIPAASVDVGITKELLTPQGALLVGRPATYRLTVTNNGPSVARDVVVVDQLPEQVSYLDARGANCSATGQRVECQLGDVDPGDVIVIELDVQVLAAGTVTNPADVTTTSPDTNPDNNHDEVTVDSGNADLAIDKTGPDGLVAGATRGYTLVVSNAGSIPSAGVVTVTDELDPRLTPVNAYGSGWACVIEGQLVTCTRSDALDVGQSFPPIRIRFETGDLDGTGDVPNTARVSLPGDTNPDNDTDTVVTPHGGGALPDSGSCRKGALAVTPKLVYVGERTKLVATVEDRDGNAIKGVKVKLSGPGRDRTARTNAAGRAKFELRASSSKQRWTVRALDCGLKQPVKATRLESCRSLLVAPGSVDAGDSSRLRVRLRSPRGNALSGVKVKAKGAGVNERARTNEAGRATLRVKPDAPGIITVTAPKAFGCAVQIGSVAGADGGQLTG